MASQWFCKVLGQEIGPVGFPDLVEMVRSGTLKEGDPVRREAAIEWTRAQEVIGLFRAGAKAAPPRAPAAPKAVSAPAKAEAVKPPAARPGRIGQRRVLVGVAVVTLVLLAAGVSAWRSGRRERFPQPRGLRPFDEPGSSAVPRRASTWFGPIWRFRPMPWSESPRNGWGGKRCPGNDG